TGKRIEAAIGKAGLLSQAERGRISGLGDAAKPPAQQPRPEIKAQRAPARAGQNPIIAAVDMRKRSCRNDGDLTSALMQGVRLLDDARIGAERTRAQDADTRTGRHTDPRMLRCCSVQRA